MNFRIVTHLLKTDWRRLRWLLLACWAILLLAAWPALSFSPGDFDMPPSEDPLYAHGNSGFDDVLDQHGLVSKTARWSFLTFGRMSIGAVLLVAGCLGFHGRMWSEGRPVRRRESILAKAAGLLVFLVLPLGLLAFAGALLHGVAWGEAIGMGAAHAGRKLPALLGVMLFGTYCGRWWTWLAGMFGMALFCMVLPRALMMALWPGPDWFSNPLTPIGESSFFPFIQNLWLAVILLGVLLLRVPRDLSGARKVGIALVSIVFGCQLTTYLSMRSWRGENPLAKLPDWSATVRPELETSSLEASIDRGVIGCGPYRRSITSFDDESYMNLLLPLKPGGLPPGSYVTWRPEGRSSLKAGDRTLSQTPANERVVGWDGIYLGEADENVLTAIVKPEGGKLRWDSPSSLVDSRICGEIFTPIAAEDLSPVELEMKLQGLVVHLEKIVDVPLGAPVTVKAEGIEFHIRRLDLPGYQPVADLCYVAPGKHGMNRLSTPLEDWLPVIYLPGESMARQPWVAHSGTMTLAPGLNAVRFLYHTGQTSGGKRDLKGYDQARFMLVKRRYLATAKAELRTPPLPLTVTHEGQDREARSHSDPPPFNSRPDPATTSPQAFEKWLKLSYAVFDKDWGGRNIADYVPRHMDRILRRRMNLSPPHPPEGRALELACPENRKREVIDALLPTNRDPQSNWIPDVLIRRGWVTDAKPEILRMLGEDEVANNIFTQLMVMELEDPQTYPALLNQKLGFETYQRLRLLPGIEPRLAEMAARTFREAEESYADRKPSDRIYPYLIPASHGNPQALARLLENWEKIEPIYRRTRAEYLREVIQLPGAPDDWRAVLGALAGRQVADFRFDPLARQWLPVTSP
ncbi:hypothetical protein [Luteolibacter sp. Populi]|uniref:hypothetical protein n=1 Tax=Luteolibacter sp. Populi TaxID=3230487 RepID=UPI003466F2DF